jgi:hypothetical protein
VHVLELSEGVVEVLEKVLLVFWSSSWGVYTLVPQPLHCTKPPPLHRTIRDNC